MLPRLLSACALLVGAAPLAHATLISSTSWDGAGNSLQEQLDLRTQGGAFLDVNADQFSPDELWTVDASGFSIGLLLFEIAGFANQNSMGIYDPSDPARRLELFSGANSAPDRAFLEETSPDTFCVWFGSCLSIDGGLFGFYLTNGNGATFFSQSALNSAAADDGTTDYMVAFQGDGRGFDPRLWGDYSPFSSGEYVIAWEDLPLYASDRDYNDMVVLIESLSPVRVPEPGSLALLAAGMLGFGLLRLRLRSARAIRVSRGER